MKIALTGASGLIGAAIARRFARMGRVLTIGRRETADQRADLSDPAAIGQIDLQGCDILIHAAGVVDEDFRDDPARAFRQATFGAAALFERAAAAGVARVAYISSAHIYGPLEGAIDEASPPDPRSDYAIAHFATEQTLKRMGQRFAATAAFRPCAVFGAPASLSQFRRWTLIPFAFPRNAITSHRIELQSTGEQSRNFVAADDIAESVARWVEAGAGGWSTCNTVGPQDLSVWQFAQLCAVEAQRLTGRPVTLSRVEPTEALPAHPLHYATRTTYGRGNTDLAAAVSDLMAQISAAQP
jgi:UDP-glucose 4-epimerase